jgi:glycosyltransferase involved in cell wall biosynthesis
LIITPSEFTKAEIIKFFKIKPEKVKVIYCGVEDTFMRNSARSIVTWKEKKGLKNKKIIGYLGSIFTRRNMPLLVEAVNLIRKEFPEIVLYVIGKDMTHPPQNMARLLDKDWVKWEMFIPENELPLFYSAIDVFAYLSEYEGFGLPPLEALSCGAIPVLLNKSSFQEIYKDMAIMVDNPEVFEIKQALRKAITDERAKLEILNRFYQKRPQFSWQRAAWEFSSIIQNLKYELLPLAKKGSPGKGE